MRFVGALGLPAMPVPNVSDMSGDAEQSGGHTPLRVLGVAQSHRTPESPAVPELDHDRPLHEVPDHEVPDHEVPDHEVPFHTMFDHEVPDQERPDQEVPDHDVPDHDVPDHEVPDHDVPDQLVPFQLPDFQSVGTLTRLSVHSVVAVLPLPLVVQVVTSLLKPYHGLPMMSCSPARTTPLFSR
jgi:hypothetical protein